VAVAAAVAGGAVYAYFRFSDSALSLLFDFLNRSIIYIAAVILLPVAAIIIRLAGLVSSRFGPGLNLNQADSSMLISSSAHRVPFQGPELLHIRFSLWRLIRQSNELLFHSRLYSCRPALAIMADWIVEKGISRPSPAGQLELR
jgi:hypothetical protein